MPRLQAQKQLNKHLSVQLRPENKKATPEQQMQGPNYKVNTP